MDDGNEVSSVCDRFKLNVWDVGGQQTIRSYWRNYFEQVRCSAALASLLVSLSCFNVGSFLSGQTDGIVWVVDSADRRRLEDCRLELRKLLAQEVLAASHVAAMIYSNILRLCLETRGRDAAHLRQQAGPPGRPLIGRDRRRFGPALGTVLHAPLEHPQLQRVHGRRSHGRRRLARGRHR
jgi:hypothetical protein